MARITLDITGNLKGAISKRREKVLSKIDDELNTFGISTVAMAQRLCPVDEGHLRNSISFTPVKKEGSTRYVDIVVATDYAAYVEFGTRKFAANYVATLPQEWRAMAAEHKGKAGGTLSEFIQRIMAWVQRKGIGAHKTKSGNVSTSKNSYAAMQQAAYAIALNILQNGVKQQPFLYPAFRKNRKRLISNLKNI
jgi:hypothetical protein